MSNDKLVWAVKNGSLEEVKKIVEVSSKFQLYVAYVHILQCFGIL